jgi:hypothetical protein
MVTGGITDLIKASLGAFAKFREATASFAMSVRPSAWNSSPPTGRVFTKFDFSIFFRKYVEKKFQFQLNLTRMTGI